MANRIVRIESITIENFKNVTQGTLDLENKRKDYKASVLGLYGQNGSGKTALIDAIQLLKFALCGKAIPKKYADYINVDAEYATLKYEFVVRYAEIIYNVWYQFSMRKVIDESATSSDETTNANVTTKVEMFDEVLSFSYESETDKMRKAPLIDTRTEELFAAFGKQPDLTLRTNTLRILREELIEKIGEAGIHALPTKESDVGIRVCDKSPVTELYGFADGLFFVQDEASQLCVKALDVKKGMRVLDACACPGSKSFGAAIDMKNEGEVIACDLHRNKLSLVEGGAARLGISILTTEERDARNTNEEWLGTFDRVLCDVPCSGFGVFAKKPELRYKSPETSAALPNIQLAILKNASSYVKVGGKLVYSTCTLLPSENEENVSRFLDENHIFTLIEQRTLYPDTDGTDGFFYAVMERVQ